MLVCFAVLIYYGVLSTRESWELDETSPGMGHPQWLYLVWLPLLTTVAALRVAGVLIRRFKRARAE